MKGKKVLIFVFFCTFLVSAINTQAQNFFQRYINSIVKDTTDISQPQFLVYPTIAYSPETSWEIGFSSMYVYYANRDTSNRLSEINGFTFFTLENQYGLWFEHALYSPEDKWFFLGKLRFQSFPLLYYGIGPDTPSDYLARVNANQIWIKERALRKIHNNLFMGLEMDFLRLSQVDFIPKNEQLNIDLPMGSEGSTNLGLGMGLVFDNRHNVLNVRNGTFSEIAFLRYNPFWSSDFHFTSIISDTRIYRPVGKNNVIAAQLFGQFNQGSVPFNQLALLGGENLMRGYYTGRFRDKNQLATQVEMRFLPLPLGFTDRFGAAVFGGVGQVFPEIRSFNMENFVWSAGAGLRFLLFPKKDIYTRFDFAFTQEGNGFYIFIGEAF